MFYEREASTITKSGWLEKQGKLQKWAWKRYWFSLEGDQLAYFKQEGDEKSSRGLIDVAQARCVRVTSQINKKFAFEIVTKNRVHVLSANDVKERGEWVSLLQQAMQIRPRMSVVMERPSCNSISDVGDDTYQQDLTPEDMAGCGDAVFYADTDQEHAYSSIDDKNIADGFSTYQKATGLPSELSSPSEPAHYEPVMTLSTEGASSKTEAAPDQEILTEHKSSTTEGQTGEAEVVPPVVMRRSQNIQELRNSKVAGSSRVTGGPIYDEVQVQGAEGKGQNTSSTKELRIPRISGVSVVSGSGVSVVSGSGVSVISGASQMEMDKKTRELYEKVKDINFQFKDIPPLPHPRIEMTWGSNVFDQIRTFIAQHRGPNELYVTPRKSKRDGSAVLKLKEFLEELDAEDAKAGVK